jgi:hypothetical protein
MNFFDDLPVRTREERAAFIATPVIQRALQEGVDRAMYLDFPGQAYHHVRHTCRLLSAAIARSSYARGPERFFVMLQRLVPGLIDQALGRKQPAV